MRATPWLAALVALALRMAPGAAISAPASGPPGSALVRLDGNSLTVELREVPLSEALRHIAARTRVRITGSPPDDERQSVAFVGLTVDEGLKRILRHRNFLLIYHGQILTEVRILSSPVPVAGLVQKPAVPRDPDRSALLRLEAEEPAVRLAAALDLAGTDRTGEALAAVLDVLVSTRADADVKRQALETLDRFESVPAPVVASLALTAPSDVLRREAVAFLARRAPRDAEALVALRQVVEVGEDSGVRGEALRQLQGLIDRPE